MTAACETCRELIGGYVLDALDPEESAVVRRHIESCQACAREHAQLATVPVLLDYAPSADAVPLRPPPRLEEAVLDRFAREARGAAPPAEPPPARTRSHHRRWLLPAAAALACAFAVLGAVQLLSDDDSGTAEQPSAQSARAYEIALTGAGPAPGAAGQARLYPGETGTGVHLKVTGLDPRAYDYELWCVRDDGWKMSAGTFRVDGNGNADVNLTTAAKPSEYDALSIQAHPAGRGDRSRGPRVLVGRIRS